MSARNDAPIDLSDIPETSPEQLARMRDARARRRGRPALGPETRRRSIAIRLPPATIEALREEATGRGIGYQTLITEILASHVRRRKRVA